MVRTTQGQEQSLHRFSLKQCDICQHVFSFNGQPDEWIENLYSEPLETEIWAIDNAEPYQSMIDFCRPYLEKTVSINNKQIVDFGCGTGALLSKLKTTYPDSQLCGLDFVNNLQCNIEFHLTNFNDYENILSSLPDGFDFGFCTHVIEHLLNPLDFLAALRHIARPDATLYLEVPAHDILTNEIIAYSNLWTPQHLHYFSQKSFRRLVQLAGWKILQEDNNVFGFTPRLCLIAQPDQDDAARQCTLKSLIKLEQQHQQFCDMLMAYDEQPPIHIWGIGSDLRRCVALSDRFLHFLSKDTIHFYDRQLSGTRYLDKPILDSTALNQVSGIIIPTAKPFNTRGKMLKIAEQGLWPAQVIDLWGQILNAE